MKLKLTSEESRPGALIKNWNIDRSHSGNYSAACSSDACIQEMKAYLNICSSSIVALQATIIGTYNVWDTYVAS